MSPVHAKRILELQSRMAQVRPGALAADVHSAAEEVYRSAGFGLAYRTGAASAIPFWRNRN